VARAVKYAAGFALGRLRGRRALLDDPYAVFAGLEVVRHEEVARVRAQTADVAAEFGCA
jgi:hypothetical protein